MSLALTRRASRAAARKRAVTYYVDTAGSNTNNGLSAAAPWQTIAKVNAAALNPGDAVRFRRGQTFTGAILLISASGTSAAPITVGAYGTGNPPIFDGGGTDTTLGVRTPIVLNGNWNVLDGVQAQHSLKDGVQVAGTDCTVQNCIITHNQQGLHVQPTGHRAKIFNNQFLHNDIVKIGAGANDDSGAVAMVLNADGCVVTHNYSTGHSGASPDYGTDGSFCEIYGASNTECAYNLSVDDKTFTELGGDSTDPAYGLPSGNRYHHNLVITRLATSSVMTLNGTGTYGPTTGTVFEHNTVYAPNAGTYGLGVESGADLTFRNNIWAFPNGNPGDVLGSAINESNNLYYGTPSNIKSANSASGTTIDETSVVANPLFVDAANNDLHLQAGSPAINIGAQLGYTVDYDGNPRKVGAAPDAGAFEHA